MKRNELKLDMVKMFRVSNKVVDVCSKDKVTIRINLSLMMISTMNN